MLRTLRVARRDRYVAVALPWLVVCCLACGARAWAQEPAPPHDPMEAAEPATEDPAEAAPDQSGGLSLPEPATGREASERWRAFVDAARGLTSWNLWDGRLTLTMGGRFQVDGTVANGSDLLEQSVGELDSSFKLRRLRLFADGTIDNHLRYLISYDFGANNALGDAFVEGTGEGLRVWGYDIGEFRLGHFQEPFSLERMTSSYWTEFIERSLPVQTFTPGRNLGFMLSDMARSQRFTWAAGFFSFGSNREENQSASALSITGRVTGLPVYRNGGRTMLHLGASFSTREPQSNDVRYQSRPEARFVPHLVDTGDIASGKNRLYGVEAAWQQGPWWAQGEWMLTEVESADSGDLDFMGGYVQVGYILTGESRPYNTSNGTFQRLMPEDVFHGGRLLNVSDRGAWGLVARFSTIDLSDEDVRGGRLTDLSLGVNWYPGGPHRISCNYIRAQVKGGGNADILVLRYQYRLR